MLKKSIGLLLALAMLFVLTPGTTLAVFQDTQDHWGQAAVEKWSSLGILQGHNGVFRPDEPITRGEMAVILDRFMRYQRPAAAGYADLDDNFYTDAVLKASAAGVIQGSGGLVRPADPITREEAAVMLGRALGLPENGRQALGFTDAGNIASWAYGYVNALSAAGFVRGSGGFFRPRASITRAEVVTILDNAVKGFYNAAGTYEGDVAGTAVVSAPDVTLKNMVISGDLIISEGVGSGSVTLYNVKVLGRTLIRGGGPNSIHITGGSHLGPVYIEKTDEGAVRVVTADGAVVDALYIDDGSDDIILSGSFTSVSIAADVSVKLVDAAVGHLIVNADAALSVSAGSSVTALTVDSGAQGSNIQISGTVGTLTVNAQAEVRNQGSIAAANINASGVVLDGKQPRQVTVGTGVTPPTNSGGSPVGGQTPAQEDDDEEEETPLPGGNTHASMSLSVSAPVFTANKPGNFTVSVNANDDAGSLVRAWFTLPAGVTLKVQENGVWTPLTNHVYGPTGGFSLENATLPFQATFTQTGTYTLTVEFRTVNGTTLARRSFTVTVGADTIAPYDITTGPDADTVALGTGESIVLTVSAKDNVALDMLKIDYSLGGTPQTYSVYADSSDPYGGKQSEFGDASVTYTETHEGGIVTGTWIIDFGQTATAALITENAAVSFDYSVSDTSANTSSGNINYSVYDNLQTAIDETAAGGKILLAGQFGNTGEFTLYTVTEAVSLQGTGNSVVYGTFHVYADGVSFDNLEIHNQGGQTPHQAQKAAIDVLAKQISITNCSFILGAEVPSGHVANGVTVWPMGSADFGLVLEGNTFIGYDPITGSWSSTAFMIVENIDINTNRFKEAVSQYGANPKTGAVTINAEDLQAIAVSNTYNQCGNDFVYSDWNLPNGYKFVYATTSDALSGGLAYAASGATVVVAEGIYQFEKQININKPFTLKGLGNVVFQANNSGWNTESGYKHLLMIIGNAANPVSISNITFDANKQNYGVLVYDGPVVALNDVTIINSKASALNVNGSTVTADNLNTNNNAWGAVNVDPGSGVTTPSVFILTGSGILAENTQIWSDGKNVTATATVTVDAAGYTQYTVAGLPNAYLWSNKPLTDMASIAKNGITTVYSSLHAAVNAAANGDTVQLGSGTYELPSQLKIDKPITITGAGMDSVFIMPASDFDGGNQNFKKHLISVDYVNGLVVLENLTVSGSIGSGINVCESTDVRLYHITSRDNTAAGLIINSSVVTADHFNTSGNGWYGINIDKGANPGAGAPNATLTLTGSGVLGETIQIVSDTSTGTVVAEGYLMSQNNGKTFWTKNT